MNIVLNPFKKLNFVFKILFLTIIIMACKTDKATQLKNLKTKVAELNQEIISLESELKIKKDSNLKVDASKLPIVGFQEMSASVFRHYIDLYGTVYNENDYAITPKQGPGQVTEIYVKKGDYVNVGQKILQLDNKIITESLLTIQKNIESIQSQLDFATVVFQKQQNLYDQKIGSEIQYLTAKNNVTQLQNTLQVTKQQYQTQKDQLDYFTVRSEVAGNVEGLNVKVGGIFNGYDATGSPQVRIINSKKLTLRANVPENYLEVVKVGKFVIIESALLSEPLFTKINLCGKTIDQITRSFFIEAPLPDANLFKPNELIPIKIQDKIIDNAIVIPLNAIQKDINENFVFILKEENGNFIAKKKFVSTGNYYKDKIVIEKGLEVGDKVIIEGMNSLFDGQLVSLN